MIAVTRSSTLNFRMIPSCIQHQLQPLNFITMGLLTKLSHIYSTVQALLVELAASKKSFDALESRISEPNFPISPPTPSLWQNPPFQVQNTKSLPKTADIIIIGSGLSGASIAYTLLKKCPGSPRIMTLETREICSGATGRNGGHIKCSAYMEYSSLKSRFGERAKQILQFQRRHMPLLLGLIAELGIEAEAREVETVDIFTDENTWNEAKRMVDLLRVDVPDAAEDIVVHEGIEGCEVCFFDLYLCLCLYLHLYMILTKPEIQRESFPLLWNNHLYRSSTITLRLHNISLRNATKEPQLHNRSQYHRYRDHNHRQQIHSPHKPRPYRCYPRHPRNRRIRSNTNPKPSWQDLPCTRPHDVAIMFYPQPISIMVYLPQAWIRLYQSTTQWLVNGWRGNGPVA